MNTYKLQLATIAAKSMPSMRVIDAAYILSRCIQPDDPFSIEPVPPIVKNMEIWLNSKVDIPAEIHREAPNEDGLFSEWISSASLSNGILLKLFELTEHEKCLWSVIPDIRILDAAWILETRTEPEAPKDPWDRPPKSIELVSNYICQRFGVLSVQPRSLGTITQSQFRELLNEFKVEISTICDAEPSLETVPVVNANTNSVQIHKIRARRRDVIDPMIELAQSKCSDKKDTATVWTQLESLAISKIAPFEASTKTGLKYIENGKAKHFTRHALNMRLHPEKRKAVIKLR